MKLNPNSTPKAISKKEGIYESYRHPWYTYNEKTQEIGEPMYIRPNPPTEEAKERAKFRDKTFHWNRDSRN